MQTRADLVRWSLIGREGNTVFTCKQVNEIKAGAEIKDKQRVRKRCLNRAVERESGLSKVENLTKKILEQGVRVGGDDQVTV